MPSSPAVINAKHLLSTQTELGEGALWHPHEHCLYWVDILKSELHFYDPESRKGRWLPTRTYVGTVVPTAEFGEVLVALQDGIFRMNTATGARTLITNPLPGHPVRFNDGKCDPAGRFWVGTIHMDGARGKSHLYRLDADGTIHEVLNDVSISNGIVWTADKKLMYYNDTPTLTVQAFDYDDAMGTVQNRRVAFSIPEEHGYPDGMSIDAEGMLWIAMWGAGSVNRYNPETGALLAQIKVPAPHTTSCAFGGADLKTLYITSARTELDAEQLARYPQSGDLFYAELDVAGVEANVYGG
jgi:sugar lactone lactonase YvrE